MKRLSVLGKWSTVTLTIFSVSIWDAPQGHAETVQCLAGQKKVGENCVDDPVAACRDRLKEVTTARKEMEEACSKARLGMGSCLQKVEQCMTEPEVSTGLDMNTLTSLMPAFGLPAVNMPATPGAQSNGCPQMSRSDYFTEKDKLDKELVDIDKDLSQIQEDLADEKKELTEKTEQINKENSQAQNDLDNAKLEANDEKRKVAADAQEANIKGGQNLREINMQMLDIRGQMIDYEHQHTQQLLALKPDDAAMICLQEVKKLRDSLDESGLFGNKASGYTFSEANNRTAALKNKYKGCMSAVANQRARMISERSNRMAKYQQQLSTLQQAAADSRRAMDSAEENMTAGIADLDTKMSKADAKMMRDTQTAMQSIQAANQTLLEKQNALSTKMTASQTRKNEVQRRITGLGAEPPQGTTAGWQDARAKVLSYYDEAASFSGCCNSEDADVQKQFGSEAACKLLSRDSDKRTLDKVRGANK